MTWGTYYATVSQKSNKRSMVGTIVGETKREGQRKAKRCTCHKNKIKGKKLVLLVVGSYFIHSPFNVACMQIMKSNNNGKFRTNINYQHNFPFYSKGKSTLKNSINMLLEKLNAKR
jgi:hypothetical protein